MKRENMIRVNKWVYDIFTVTNLQFMCTNEDVVRNYTLKFKWEHWFDIENF